MKKRSLKNIKKQSISHNPAILKQMLIGWDEQAPINQFARAVFPPGESVPSHQHGDMIEVFYVESGSAVAQIAGQEVELNSGDCLTVEPGEDHAITSTGDSEFVVLYFGVVV
jgi:mannose-6-phosphate isomerase-like protein (cupin superfamily)